MAKQPTVYKQTLPTGATLKVFRATEEKANGKAVIIIPGGGYSYVAGSYEGSDWAPLFLDLGFTAAVLTYNLPHGNPEIPLADGRAALQYLRDNAEDLRINPDLIGVMGFSAGGHLASTIATHLTGDELPAFQILFYPVITMESRNTHAGTCQNLLGDNPSNEMVLLYSNEKQVSSETPIAYLSWATDDSTVKPINSTKYRAALKNAGVDVTYKTYSSGGHGFGFSTSFKFHDTMVDHLTSWLEGLDDKITGISLTQPSDEALLHGRHAQALYDLFGRRLSSIRGAGIYIVAGKKLLVR